MKKSWFLHEQLSESQALRLWNWRNATGKRIVLLRKACRATLSHGNSVCCCRNPASHRALTEPTHKKCGGTDARITKC